jgi:hypothetical protein
MYLDCNTPVSCFLFGYWWSGFGLLRHMLVSIGCLLCLMFCHVSLSWCHRWGEGLEDGWDVDWWLLPFENDDTLFRLIAMCCDWCFLMLSLPCVREMCHSQRSLELEYYRHLLHGPGSSRDSTMEKGTKTLSKPFIWLVNETKK